MLAKFQSNGHVSQSRTAEAFIRKEAALISVLPLFCATPRLDQGHRKNLSC